MSTQANAARTAKRVFALIFASAVPLILRSALDADIGFVAILFATLLTAGLGIARRESVDPGLWLRFFSAVITAAFGIVVLVGIIITPLSAYVAWFTSFKHGSASGGVSSIFVLVIAFFSSTLSPLIVTTGIVWTLIIICFVLLYLLAVILQTSVFLLPVIAVLAAGFIYFAVSRVRRGRRASAGIFAVGLLAVTFIAASLFPGMHNPPGSTLVDSTVSPKLRTAVISMYPNFPLLYAVPGYGISFDEEKLGGKPTLTAEPIMTVRGKPGEVIYLRTRVFDVYSGSAWLISDRLAQENEFSTRRRLFVRSMSDTSDALKIDLQIKDLAEVPFTLNTEQIYIPNVRLNIEQGNSDTGFQLGQPLRRNDVIYLKRGTGPSEATAPLDPVHRGLYLQIPTDLPVEIRTIAAGLSRGLTDQRAILRNIESFLATNYAYNLDVQENPTPGPKGAGHQDFVYSFLFNQDAGYCVQFATSFIILARLNGIPARYATGYLVYIPNDSSEGEVTGLSSHAWPEVWLPDAGWVNWEATPAANPSNYTQDGQDWVFNYGIDLNRTTSRQLQGLLGVQVATSAPTTQVAAVAGVPKPAHKGVLVFILLGAALLLGLMAWGGVRFVLPRVGDERERFFYQAGRLVRKFRHRGVPHPQQVGWVAWTEALRQRVGANGDHVDQLGDMLIRATYGEGSVDDGASRRLAQAGKYVRKHLKRRYIRKPGGAADSNPASRTRV